MKLVKVENKARGELLGFYIVACGECVRVDPWNCYRFRLSKEVDGKQVSFLDHPEMFEEEKAQMLKKQKNNWRKLYLMPIVEVETYDELFKVIKDEEENETAYQKYLADYDGPFQGGGIDD